MATSDTSVETPQVEDADEFDYQAEVFRVHSDMFDGLALLEGALAVAVKDGDCGSPVDRLLTLAIQQLTECHDRLDAISMGFPWHEWPPGKVEVSRV